MRVHWFGPEQLDAFAAVAWPLLAADPVRHTAGLTVLDRIRRHPTTANVAVMLTVHDGDRPVGALLRTAGRPALADVVRPEHAAAVDAALAEHDPELPGLTGPVEPVTALAAAHAARTRTGARADMRMRLFALDELVPPVGVAGAVRPAAEPDLGLLVEWLGQFRREATRTLRDPHPPVARVRLGLADDRMLLWELDGRPVALAVAQRAVAGMTRIGPVYTPPADRRRGFGAAVTAAAARVARDGGSRHVVLFVDQANPTSNRLYTRLGFRPVHEAVEISFDVTLDREVIEPHIRK